MNQYPNLSLTVLIAFAFFTPFILAKKFSEPYPAIILPSEAGKIDVSVKNVIANRTSLWSKPNKDDTWVRIDDVETFLEPIPVQYLRAIAKNSFGLNSAKGKIINLPRGVSILSKKVTLNEVKEAKHWLRQKLVQSGYDPKELMITFEKVTFNVETGKIIEINISYEEIVRLD